MASPKADVKIVSSKFSFVNSLLNFPDFEVIIFGSDRWQYENFM